MVVGVDGVPPAAWCVNLLEWEASSLTRTHTHTFVRTLAHTHAHACTHTHTNTHTHTHTPHTRTGQLSNVLASVHYTRPAVATEGVFCQGPRLNGGPGGYGQNLPPDPGRHQER